VALTGVTGGIGGRVAARLAGGALGPVRPVAIVRDLERLPAVAGLFGEEMGAEGYRDETAFGEALGESGATTLLLVSGRESASRVVEHAHAVHAAAAAGIEHVVYTSFLGASPDATFTFARDHYATEQLLRESGMAWTFLRDSQYLDYVPLLPGADGVIRGPAGDGRIAWVSRDDVADVAAAVLADPGAHAGATYDLTGPASQTLAWAASVLSGVVGRPITFEDETVEEAYASRVQYDAPDFEVDGWVTSYTAVATGELDVVSDAVERVAGHPPQDLPGWLEANPEAWAHLR
jgi:NAD(P)H dehydrogenase (quinone)